MLMPNPEPQEAAALLVARHGLDSGSAQRLPHLHLRRLLYEAGLETPVTPSYVDAVVECLPGAGDPVPTLTRPYAQEQRKHLYRVTICKRVSVEVYLNSDQPLDRSAIERMTQYVEVDGYDDVEVGMTYHEVKG